MRCLSAPRHSLAEFSGLQILYSWGRNTLLSPCSYIVVASSSSCAQVSLVSAGFTSWLTVSITIKGMIGSFKSVLKSLVSCLLLSILLGSFQSFTVTAQWNVEICCTGLFLLHGYCFFLDLWLKSLALFWVIYTYEWRFMPVSSMCQYYPIKLGCSLAPEIALKCNINAAIPGLLPLWNTRYLRYCSHVLWSGGICLFMWGFMGDCCGKLIRSCQPCLIHLINDWMRLGGKKEKCQCIRMTTKK